MENTNLVVINSSGFEEPIAKISLSNDLPVQSLFTLKINGKKYFSAMLLEDKGTKRVLIFDTKYKISVTSYASIEEIYNWDLLKEFIS